MKQSISKGVYHTNNMHTIDNDVALDHYSNQQVDPSAPSKLS
jgi:hypothetical protein